MGRPYFSALETPDVLARDMREDGRSASGGTISLTAYELGTAVSGVSADDLSDLVSRPIVLWIVADTDTSSWSTDD